MTEKEEETEDNSGAQTTEETEVPTQWYALRVQSNREEEVRDNLVRALAVEEVDEHLARVLVPTESVTEVRSGEKKVVERKLFPGYVLVEVIVDEHGHVPEDLWYIIREARGVGDFIGGEEPWPLRDEEVEQMLGKAEEKEEEGPKLKIDFEEGDMVEINEGSFRDMEGRVEEVNPATGRVQVVVNIFGRSTSVELEYWQVEPV